MSRKYTRYQEGQRFGKLSLIERMPGGQKWKAVCDCGDTVIFQVSSGQTMCRSCAYKVVAKKNTVHGESPSLGKNASRLYGIWLGMKVRCTNPKAQSHKYYIDRGISVCDEWSDYSVFKEWALSHGYSDNLTIDRIDVNGDYCPENCRWVTQSEQMRNTRKNHCITYMGETKTLAEWSEITGVPYHTLKSRINNYGFSAEEALTLPVKTGNNQSLRRKKDD